MTKSKSYEETRGILKPYAHADRLANQEGLLDQLKSDADKAYCRYVDMIDQKCRGTDYKISNGEFTDRDLDNFKKAYDMYGFHRGIQHAIGLLRKALTNT